MGGGGGAERKPRGVGVGGGHVSSEREKWVELGWEGFWNRC